LKQLILWSGELLFRTYFLGISRPATHSAMRDLYPVNFRKNLELDRRTGVYVRSCSAFRGSIVSQPPYQFARDKSAAELLL
jgi:hypothetical protein